MKISDAFVQKVYTRLLETSSLDDVKTSGLAAVIDDDSSQKTAVVYDTNKFVTVARAGGLGNDDSFVVGFVSISEPQGAACRGAWMIRGISGPGKIMYGVAYALSPNGLITPDRSNVSSSAASAWKNYAIKAAARGDMMPLDDADHPSPGTDAFHDKHHTQDQSDDCYTSHTEPYLNSAYRGPGGEGALLERLYDSHLELMTTIAIDLGMKQEDVESTILDAGYTHFDTAMGY